MGRADIPQPNRAADATEGQARAVRSEGNAPDAAIIRDLLLGDLVPGCRVPDGDAAISTAGGHPRAVLTEVVIKKHEQDGEKSQETALIHIHEIGRASCRERV